MRMFLIAATTVAALAAASPANALAVLSVNTTASADDPVGDSGVHDDDRIERIFFPGMPRNDVQVSSEAAGFGALGVAEAGAAFGVNRVFARATSSAVALEYPGYVPAAAAGASSTWGDDLTINTVAPGGFVTFEFQFHAFRPQSSYDYTPSMLIYSVEYINRFPYNEYELYFFNMDAFGNIGTFVNGGPDQFELVGDNTGDVLRLVGVRVPFTSNTAFGISSWLRCKALAPYDAANVQTCNASGTALWGGITGVTDVNGNALTDWTVSSSSGTDYTQSLIPPAVASVPEPSSWAMMILGFGAVGAAIRRRRPLAA